MILESPASVSVADELVAGLDAGAMVGEMALVDHRPRRQAEETPKARDRVPGLLMARRRPTPGT